MGVAMQWRRREPAGRYGVDGGDEVGMGVTAGEAIGVRKNMFSTEMSAETEE